MGALVDDVDKEVEVEVVEDDVEADGENLCWQKNQRHT